MLMHTAPEAFSKVDGTGGKSCASAMPAMAIAKEIEKAAARITIFGMIAR
ncbi:hypothetical protein [Novosphingobium sp. PhB165]|nr:hypothetical protein [Novosphingobium sp. PhB165]